MTDHIQMVCSAAGTDHDGQHCPLCDGGLSWCSVCGGAEGSMPTDCPGYRLDPDTLDAVYNKRRDFKNGEWTGETQMMYGHGYNGMHNSYDVYLAGPFFNTKQKMVMVAAKMILEEAGLSVCDPQDLSPVIVDLPEEERKAQLFETIYKNNIEGMRRSYAMCACIDDRDTGTAFEIGWFIRDMKIVHNGALFTFSGFGYGCNVMLQQAVDGHSDSLDDLKLKIADVGPWIKARQRDKILELAKGKAGADQ